MKVLISSLLLFVAFVPFFPKHSNASSVVCDKSWVVYKDESCFQVTDDVMKYESAERGCALHSNGHLAVIESQEMQSFLNDYLFKEKKVANDVWIGGRFNATSHRISWNSGTSSDHLPFTNWASGSPKNLTNYCVQLTAEQSLAGKWADEQCSRLNQALCQRPQSWSLATFQQSFLSLKKRVETLEADPGVPLGFIYVQLPKEAVPEHIWPKAKWTEVTAAYAGVFFRAEGAGSEAFGAGVQAENVRRISRLEYVATAETGNVWSTVLTTEKEGHFTVKTGVYSENNYGAQTAFKVDISGGELRPRNMAIKIWKRTG